MSKLDELINEVCPNGVEYKKLGDSKLKVEIGTGNNNTQDAEEDGIYPFFVRSKYIKKSNTFSFEE